MKEKELRYTIRKEIRNALQEEASLNEFVWPQSKLSPTFQLALKDELNKKFSGMWYVVGYDLHLNDVKVYTIREGDSVNKIVSHIKKNWNKILKKVKKLSKYT